MDNFYFITAASTKKFIRKFTNYSVKSLLRAGVNPDSIYIVGRDKEDYELLRSLFPDLKNISMVNEDLSYVVWQYHKRLRKYSLFKAAALYKTFPKPIDDKCMIYFDGDVLWYKNPTSFFDTKCEKTWFHHGKALTRHSPAGLAGKTSRDIDVTKIESLGKWCSLPMADLMIRHKATRVPDYEVVAGLYLLHPRDHERLLKLTYKCCKQNAKKFRKHEGGGDQKPMNAALNILNVDWHGGSRFFCPEHKEYFDHYFGKDDMKQKFWARAKRMGL